MICRKLTDSLQSNVDVGFYTSCDHACNKTVSVLTYGLLCRCGFPALEHSIIHYYRTCFTNPEMLVIFFISCESLNNYFQSCLTAGITLSPSNALHCSIFPVFLYMVQFLLYFLSKWRVIVVMRTADHSLLISLTLQAIFSFFINL